MKKWILFVAATVLLPLASKAQDATIQWKGFEALSNPSDGITLVYIYSTWCNNSKNMEALTLEDPAIVSYIHKNLLPIKLDAEHKSDIKFKGKVYSYSRSLGRGYNELSLELTRERLILPSLVLIDENLRIIQSIPGFKSKEELLPILVYFAEDYYKKIPWKSFLNEYTKKNP
jgi:thioredoxin-related protein